MIVEQWLREFVTSDAPRGSAALDASAHLFAALGDPQDRVPAIHVVGSAGKGTTASMIASGLRRGGDRVGLHMSPHVHDVRERFTVGESLPSWTDVEAAVDEIDPVAQSMRRSGAPPTFFAITAAIAAVMARQAETDWLVVEAGIGGRVDATNVFSRNDTLTVVTAIAIDHSEVLGETVAEIAAEKAAVLKGRTHAVLGPQSCVEAAVVIRDIAASVGCQLIDAAAAGDWMGDARSTAAVVLHLLGERTTRVFPIGETSFRLPGRFETYTIGQTRIIFDGAHNPMKLRALADTLRTDPFGPVCAVVAIGAGKDLVACAEEIARFADSALVTTFGPPGSDPGPRSRSVTETAIALSNAGVRDVEAFESVDTGRHREALQNRNEPATVVVTGSFLHLTAVREALVQGS